MTFKNFIPDALAMIAALEVPEADFAQVVNDQARLMAGMALELAGDIPVTSPYHALQF